MNHDNEFNLPWLGVMFFAACMLVLLTAGCVSGSMVRETSDFGMTRLEVRTPSGAYVKLDLGKEYASFTGSLAWTETGQPLVHVSAVGVRAFEGQALASAVSIEVQRQLTARLAEGGEITADIASAITRSVLGGMLLSPAPVIVPGGAQ